MKHRNITRDWVYATVFGSLWGALEITLGALIHALRIPLAGVWMAAAGVIILICGLMIYPRRGFALRVGVVCMLLKLVNPSIAFVLAAISIIMEAVAVEIIIGDGRFGRLRAILAGGVAVLMPFFQFLLYALIIYGWDVVRVYYIGIQKMLKWMAAPEVLGYGAVATIIAGIFMIGVVSALVGLRIGGAVLEHRENFDHVS